MWKSICIVEVVQSSYCVIISSILTNSERNKRNHSQYLHHSPNGRGCVLHCISLFANLKQVYLHKIYTVNVEIFAMYM